jgi:peptide/nickel transport system substrate-binding protein
MAQEQLDDEEGCSTNLSGTGPFKKKEWVRNRHFVAVANRDYWYDAPDEEPYPYLDEIEYRPIAEGVQRLNALQSGEIQAMHTSSASQILALRDDVAAGSANLLESDRFGEVYYLMLNSQKPPLDDIRIRKALQIGIDRDLLNETINEGLSDLADGPFASGIAGHLDDSGWPEFDAGKAKAMVDDYEADHGDDTRISLTTTSDPEAVETAELIKNLAADIGIEVDLETMDQAKLITHAVSRTYGALVFRNHPGGDPDTQYVWWHSGSGVNFGGIDDPKIDKLLEAGRVETVPAKRRQIYEDVTRQFAKEAWNIWAWFAPWAIGLAADVHGVYGPQLPDGSDPNPGLAAGHSVLGLRTETRS